MWNASPLRIDYADFGRVIQITGTGAADPTLNLGQSCTVKWISTGLYEITWKENPGKFRFLGDEAYQATTASALKGFSIVAGAYDAVNYKLRFSLTNAADTLADLQVLQTLTLVGWFATETAP